MSDDNVINFSSKKIQKNTSQKSYEMRLAQHIIESDPALMALIEKLQITREQAATWMIQIVKFKNELNLLVYNNLKNSQHSAFFSGLIIQILANECSDILDSIGHNPDINKEIFQNFQRNAISSIIDSKHRDDFKSNEYDGFTEGKADDDRYPES